MPGNSLLRDLSFPFSSLFEFRLIVSNSLRNSGQDEVTVCDQFQLHLNDSMHDIWISTCRMYRKCVIDSPIDARRSRNEDVAKAVGMLSMTVELKEYASDFFVGKVKVEILVPFTRCIAGLRL